MAKTDVDNELFDDDDDENLAAEATDIALQEEMKDIAPQEEMKDIAPQEEMKEIAPQEEMKASDVGNKLFNSDDENLAAEATDIAPQEEMGSCVSIHSSGFRDLPLKPELLRAIVDCGFQNPSEVQNECLPQAIQGMDILCQANSYTDKTAVFVLATLQQLKPITGQVSVLVLVHSRDLAFQISKEYERFSKYMPSVKVAVFCGSFSIRMDEEMLKVNYPHIVVGTPARILALSRSKKLNLGHIKHFILDECDKMLEKLNFRKDFEKVFYRTPHEKQVMMFSSTISEKTRPVCRLFMRNPIKIFVGDETKLTLHGLQHFYVKLEDNEKDCKLINLLGLLKFNKMVIFVKSMQRCVTLTQLLVEQNFSAVAIHRAMSQEERLSRYKQLKDFQCQIVVATNQFSPRMHIEGLNLVFNYDMPDESDTYLYRVARAGSFGNKGLAISFVCEVDEKVLNKIQDRFEVNISELTDDIDISSCIEQTR